MKELTLGTADTGSMHLLGPKLPSRGRLLVSTVSYVGGAALLIGLGTIDQIEPRGNGSGTGRMRDQGTRVARQSARGYTRKAFQMPSQPLKEQKRSWK